MIEAKLQYLLGFLTLSRLNACLLRLNIRGKRAHWIFTPNYDNIILTNHTLERESRRYLFNLIATILGTCTLCQ